MTVSAPSIRVRVRLFAMQREIARARQIDLELPEPATIEDAWAALVELHPALAPGRVAVRFARNGDYAPATEPLADGDEVACIPPVSGGAEDVPAEPRPAAEPGSAAEQRPAAEPGRSDRRRILEIRTEAFDPSILADLAGRLATEGDGAVVAFIGRTRRTPGTPAPGQEAEAAKVADGAVESLEYEAHETMARRILERIADEVAERYGVERLAIVHRTGEVPLGEASVAIVAVAPHRDAAFEAARYAIDETKARAPIWKAERFADGRVWVGEPARPGPAS